MPRSVRVAFALSALALLPLVHPTAAEGADGTMRSSGRPEVVIYNDDLALVREPKTLNVPKGVSELALEGVPQRLDSTSTRLEGDGFRVLRQTFRFDLWNGDRVFRRFLGDSISYRYGGRAYHGVLAGIDGDDLFIVRRDSAQVVTILNRRQITDVEFPSRLKFRTRPSLLWQIESAKGGEQKGTLSYLTAGIEWSAEYSAVLDADERGVELSGWATIVNRSGSSFTDAKVSLVAGEIHRDSGSPDRGAAVEEAPVAPAARPNELFAYHWYPLAGSIDLDQLATVQAVILPSTHVTAARTYRYDGARDGSKIRVQVEFGNEKGSGLGLPLPEGRVRVYVADAGGASTLVGEDRLPHTAAGERIRILSGIAFDLVGERSRASHTRVSRNVTEDEFRIQLRNHGSRPAKVTVVESLYGNWEITQKSHDFRKKDADTAEFDVPVPAGKEAVLTYTVRYTF
ncbi:MAG TPA: DUF4139 domain-containing protein [Candidatus Eisenbacteria bacterium]|nr:DUF4139 domain-containing protein [Candidatus Eisenbacteria bacterium]